MKALPEFCYGVKRQSTEGIVTHYFSCINVDEKKWDDPKRIWELFHDLNLRPNQRIFDPWSQSLNPVRDAQGKRGYASADVMILRDGDLIDLVPKGYKTYHAGYSRFKNKDNCNMWMAGAELIAAPQMYTHDKNLSTDQILEHKEKFGFNEKQYETYAEYCANMCREYDFSKENIVGHDAVRRMWNNTHPHKKTSVKFDPGRDFNYQKLYQKMIAYGYPEEI